MSLESLSKMRRTGYRPKVVNVIVGKPPAWFVDGPDVVVIREQDTAENGDIVVALVERHEATLKRYRRKGGMIALEAANPAYETRVLPEDKVRVQGRLVGLIRSY